MAGTCSKLSFRGRLFSVQPRIRLTRSFDESSHSYLGYVLGLRGTIGDAPEPRDYRVGIGKSGQEKHAFQVGDEVSGQAEPVPFPQEEPCDYYKATKLKVIERSASGIHEPPPWHGVPPTLPVYRERGHTRLAARTYATSCSSCMWGCRMPVQLIKDHWNPRVGVKWRYETFCYGPKDCTLYAAGAKREAPGRKPGMVWVEEDWVDEVQSEHRGPGE